MIAELGSNLPQNSHKVIDGTGLVLAPAFVDPHVHLRTPGREDEETIATGTRAAAAGGYCAILAMPNTEPVVDSAAVLGALVEQARADAEVQVGFLAAISKGQEGSELTEMGELADEGAVGFTDDGQPGGRDGAHVARAPVRVDHRPAARGALRGPDALARRPHARRSRLRGARDRRLAVDRRERDGRARPRAGAVREPDAPPDAPLRAGLGRGAPASPCRGSPRDRRGDAAPSRAHGRGGAHASTRT